MNRRVWEHCILVVILMVISIFATAGILCAQQQYSIYDLFITTITETGTQKIIGINILVLGALLIPLIQAIVKSIKKLFPNLQKKAWIPITLGVVGFIATGLSTGQINSWTTCMSYIIAGVASGGIASSTRDMWVGK